MKTIALVAGERSGDLLGGELLRGISSELPGTRYLGIGGEAMRAQGLAGVYPMERLAVMGLVEVAGRLRELLRQRRELARRLIADPPDLFIGIDAPDYNLGLERRLRAAGIPVIHYVSPSVWAWRGYRVRRMRECMDKVLCLFPFEVDYYRHYGIDASFVGHPLADLLPVQPLPPLRARRALQLPSDGPLIALLPGSRRSEVKALWPVMLQTALWLADRRPDARFAAPAASPVLGQLMRAAARAHPGPAVSVVDGHSHELMEAADVVLLASGTAALEAMLLKRPTVVTYRLNPLTAFLVRRLQTVRYFSLPNNLAQRELFPELMQEQCRPELLGQAVLDYLDDPARVEALQEAAQAIHQSLLGDGQNRAARAVLEFLGA